MLKQYAKIAIACALFFLTHVALADSFPPEMNVLMTLGGKKACDQAMPQFSSQTGASYAAWTSRHAALIEKTKSRVGGEDKFHATINKFAADLLEKFRKEKTTESEQSAYCKEIADWLQSPSD